MPQLTVPSPLGPLVLTETESCLTRLDWGETENEETALLREAARQLAAYFAGELHDFDLPLHLAGSTFQRRVWAAMQRIPYGETRSYGEVAEELGAVARAVGGACGRNPIPIIVPCHRILAAKGGIGGYSGGGSIASKRFLLGLETGAAEDGAALPLFASHLPAASA